MNYYQIFDDYYLDYGVTGGPTLPDGSCLAGEPVNVNDLPELIFEIDTPDDEECPHFMSAGALIVSELFTNILKNSGVANFQFFPVVLINPETKKTRDGYGILNVLTMIQAACLESSSYDTLMEGNESGSIPPLLAFDNLVLDSTKLGKERMFRLAEDPTMLIIDQSLREAIKKNSPDGGWGVMLEELTVI
jgi:hypothetical protein